MKAKYFLIKGCYNLGDFVLRYCPMGEMWADILTKPLQGQKFRDMQAFLQNCSIVYKNNLAREEDERERARYLINEKVKTDASLWECVGKHRNRTSQEPNQPRATSPTCVSQICERQE
jgi:hypothetical protein